ncbi:peroxidase family protein [Brevifollis gellanilyticus]|nr:peroxidase family protein [Brevifollis gellanilyticus]
MKTIRHPMINRVVPAAALFALSSAALAQQGPPPMPNGAAPIPRMDPGKQPPQGQPPQGQQPPQNGQAPKPPQNAGKPQPPAMPASFILPAEFRTVDGSANNAANPTWGTPNQPFVRLAPNAYGDGVSTPAGATRPSPRVISNAVAKQQNDRPNRRGASDMLWQWGQFLDHDLDETPAANPAEAFPVAVPTGDPSFDPTSTGTATMALNRSAYVMVNGVREQKSAITAWIDASQVYGSDAARSAALRANDGTGRLRVTTSVHGDLLPTHSDTLAALPPAPGFFVAGDVRVNEQVGLIAIHTLFLREHNFWADLYRAANPSAPEDEIYSFARIVVGAEMQAITYREFLPVLLGPGAIPPYRGYKNGVNPTISNEFATAAYRIGHSLLSSTLLRLDATGAEIEAGNLSLAQSFFQPGHITDEGVDPILRGLCIGRAQELDEWVIDDVRDFLFGPPGAGGLDLASLNLQRGRDHGLPSFAQMRAALKLRPVNKFQDVNPNRQVVAELDAAYDSAADIDLWIGGLAEADRPGSMVGETFQKILVDQFVRVRDGDRFWYEWYLPRDVVRMINAQTLSVIVHRNTKIGAEVGPNAFISPPPKRVSPAGKQAVAR